MMSVGLAVSVADAVAEVRLASKWVLNSPGGKGALRELIERLLKAKGLWDDFLSK